MKKMLMLATTASMIDQFNMNNIELLKNLKFEVEIACNFNNGNSTSIERIVEFKKELKEKNVEYYNLPISRNIKNLKDFFISYKKIKDIFKNKNYNFVHCHTPIGGALCRIVAKHYRKNGLKVIYTAHGFHFYKGAPLVNWLLYYPIEKVLSKYTDYLITINNEDYLRAKKRFKCRNIIYIPGIGIDVNKYSGMSINIRKKKAELNLPEESFILLSVGELNNNKNHKTVINALSKLNNRKIHYIIAGTGKLENELSKLINNLDMNKNIHLLGYRNDIKELLEICDLFCFPSKREGLPVSILEAMASGLPIVASRIRGITDCCKNGYNSILCNPESSENFKNAINELFLDKDKKMELGKNSKLAVNKFRIENINQLMNGLYKNI